LIYNGVLIPNTELGHIQLEKGKGDAEKYAASSVREKLDMGYKKWAKRLTKYYGLMEKYFNPDLFVVGGGVSRVSEQSLLLLCIMKLVLLALHFMLCNSEKSNDVIVNVLCLCNNALLNVFLR